MTKPSELLDKIRRGCTTKDMTKEDIPALMTLFEKYLIIIDQICLGERYYSKLIEK